jgi:hypothetical protein
LAEGPDGYFDERVAARYDESSSDMFDPAVVDPAVDFLAELGRRRTGARARDRNWTDRVAVGAARRSRSRHRAIASDGRAAAR